MSKNILIETKPANPTPIHTINQSALDCVLNLERPAAVAALNGIAAALQFVMFNQADYMSRERVRKQRLDELGLKEQDSGGDYHRGKRSGLISPDLDQRNAIDADEAPEPPAGMEVSETPEERLDKLAAAYDLVIHRLDALHPDEYSRPRSLQDSFLQFLENGARPPADTTVEALKAAGVTDAELADISNRRAETRKASLRERAKEVVGLIQSRDNGWEPNSFDSLPIARQLGLGVTAWKSISARRKQLVLYIASSGKTEQLSDVDLMKRGMATMEAWCLQFEKRHSLLFGEMIDAGLRVPSIDDAKKAAGLPQRK